MNKGASGMTNRNIKLDPSLFHHSCPPVFAALLAILLAGGQLAGAGQIYDNLNAVFSSVDHRQPGSEQFARCLETLDATLNTNGLQTYRQTFNTLVPETREIFLEVDGQRIEPVYAFGPNGVATMSTGNEPISGPLVRLGDLYQPEAINGQPLTNAVVVADLDTPVMNTLFSEGAAAIVFVGNQRADQWLAASLVAQHPLNMPRLFIHRETAEKYGLLEPSVGKTARLKAVTVWKDVEAVNLWLHIPGEKGAIFDLDSEEALVLSANLSTTGLIPEYNPQLREAANVALLAETAVRLAAEDGLKRSVFVVFFGSDYAVQDGARHFFYAVNKSEEGVWNPDPLDVRHEEYVQEMAVTRERLEYISQDNPLQDVWNTHFDEILKRMRKRLTRWVNELNYEIRERILTKNRINDLYRQRDKMRDKQRLDVVERYERELERIQRQWGRVESLDADLEKLKQEKRAWNNLRDCLRQPRQSYDSIIAMDHLEQFKHLKDILRRELEKRLNEQEQMIKHNLTFQVIARHFNGKHVIGQFAFDFADDEHDWAFSPHGDNQMLRKDPMPIGLYIGYMRALGQVYDSVASSQWPCRLVKDTLNCRYPIFSLNTPSVRSTSCMTPALLGIVGFQMVTVGDPLDRDEMPMHVDVSLDKLAGPMQRLFAHMARTPTMSVRSILKRERHENDTIYRYENGKYQGVNVQDYAKGSDEMAGVSRMAIAYTHDTTLPSVIPGHSRLPMARVNEEGYMFIPLQYDLGADFTRRISAVGFNRYGQIDRFTEKMVARVVRLFYNFGGHFHIPYNPVVAGAGTRSASLLLNARTDAQEKYVFIGDAGKDFQFGYGRNIPFKYIGANGVMLLGSVKDNPKGVGIPFANNGLYNLNTIRRSAHDYLVLNQSRLNVLRKKNIINNFVEKLHDEARQHMEDANQTRKVNNLRKARAHEVFSLGLSYRAYTPLKGITDDLVQAVVVLLLLNIPFAFAMERLLFGFVSIYKQIGGFSFFFILTFVILYLVHPAFALAQAPVVIFLAFVIILMSGMVIYLLMTKFREEIKALQGMASTLHGGSEKSTGMAAVMIGISGMRNRPIKTMLTAITVVLLTFAILVFASFTAKLGVTKTYMGKGDGVDRIELHRFSFLEINSSMIGAVRALYENNYHICLRSGRFYNPVNSGMEIANSVIYNPANGKTFDSSGVLGFQPEEARHNATLAKIVPGLADYEEDEFKPFDENELPPIYLPQVAVEHLKLTRTGQVVKLIGREFRYAGIFNRAALSEAQNIDYSMLAPPDFNAIMSDQKMESIPGSRADEQFQKLDTSNFIWMNPEMVVITSYKGLKRVGDAMDNMLVLYPRKDRKVGSAAFEIAEVFDGPIYAKDDQGAFRYFYTRIYEGSGFSEVVIPLLLGGLIIFSSLLGSIVDREREIYTYSALGLSPPSVGALFFAESSVYAVVGGMGGYLFSQLIAKMLEILGSYGLFHPPEMNFSSLSSVSTILVVMATVLLSTIYPAMMAGRSANPGVARKWKMPKPNGDRLDFLFPFTVSRADLAGILSFIREHFENHSDASLGTFAAKEVELFKIPGKDDAETSLGIKALISLAPFDLGVFQEFSMSSTPSHIEGIEEVFVRLHKINGAPGAWLRGNRGFIDELRNQFLLWRSLPIETMEKYRQETDEMLSR